MNVLIVDDDASVRFTLRRVLTQELKCTVGEAVDGADALRQVARGAFELLLLDLVMPHLDGVETLAALRRDARFAGLPVVVLTGDREEDTVRRVMALGVCDYLSKPLNIPHVIGRLRRVVPAQA